MMIPWWSPQPTQLYSWAREPGCWGSVLALPLTSHGT